MGTFPNLFALMEVTPRPLNHHAYILGPTLFLIFINRLLDVISSQIGVYSDDTASYSCFNSNTDRFD